MWVKIDLTQRNFKIGEASKVRAIKILNFYFDNPNKKSSKDELMDRKVHIATLYAAVGK